HYFHVHVAEPVHIVHTPVAVANWNQPIAITARVNCATRNCTGTMSYRVTAGLTTVNGLVAYANGGPPFTDVAMQNTVVQDLGTAGTAVEMSATIPATAVTTEGLDYYIHVTDGATDAWYPGTSYVAGAGSVNG